MHRSRRFIPSTKNVCLAILDLPDCISLSEKGECGFLRIGKCQGKGCSFKKSKTDSSASEEYWKSHLSSLDEEKQNRIASIYYRGKMPWNE